ncbi:protein-L-isoaspartate(D-aspartate) O-methyltransferase [Aquiflexum balticum DSM 16537]|uniref:Protein-L-isoaspartate O-methyltransferase n=1 Tax=Aquiflexum balticum DSM 16537 TaxID=758820 RepID=A0A1W2HBN1_9BACT|nr:protein-L-isoaspartate(D-aspartate) O-methyltransferase [Aquiflexum balticum]SMD46214.1 protein-L-isoaspartate(D-aspartate) O-methyltransferase [Aquiflexum balticum DSM 16537]
MKHIYFIMILFAYFQTDPYRTERLNMVKSQIENRGIKNPLVLEAMRKVPRHLFVPEYQKSNAYEDRPLSIGDGQTISQPYIVAHMTAIINPLKGMKVLEIGTGSGYQAAVLAEIVDQVFTIEIVENLGKRAKADLEKSGYKNVFVKIGDGYQGWPSEAPFDAILVTAAAENIPQPLIDQLKEGGRMVIPVGKQGEVQDLILIEKIKGKIRTTNLGAVRFVPFTRN